MKKVKLISIENECLLFSDGWSISSHHEAECCEHHWMETGNLDPEDFEGLEFDMDSDKLIELVEDYGIRLHPITGHPIPIPCYGSNNGYYSFLLSIVVTNGDIFKTIDATACQEVD